MIMIIKCTDKKLILPQIRIFYSKLYSSIKSNCLIRCFGEYKWSKCHNSTLFLWEIILFTKCSRIKLHNREGQIHTQYTSMHRTELETALYSTCIILPSNMVDIHLISLLHKPETVPEETVCYIPSSLLHKPETVGRKLNVIQSLLEYPSCDMWYNKWFHFSVFFSGRALGP